MTAIAEKRQAIQTVFIADDDVDDAELFKDALHEINAAIRIEHLVNGVALLRLLTNITPDLLFLDLDMPQKNGLQCLEEIRKNPATSLLPTVVFSSTSRPANIETAYEMGAHLFFIKPSNYKELVRPIEGILELDWSNPEKVREQFYSNGQCLAFAVGKPE